MGSSGGKGGGGKGGPVGALSNGLTNLSASLGLKKPLDDLGSLFQPPKIPAPAAPAAPAMPDMGQTVGMAGGDTATAGGEFDLGKDEDEQSLRTGRKKRRGRRELTGSGVGLSAGTSDVGVKI